MKPVITAAAIATGLLLTGCGGDAKGGVLDSTETACDDFAAHAKAGLPKADRADVVAGIGKVIDNAKPKVRDAFAPLQRTATGSDTAYRTAADGFAQACFDAGWKG